MSLEPITEPSYDDLPPFDHARAEAAVRELLPAIGEDPDREGLRETPARVARAYAELLRGIRERPEDVLTTTFELGHEEMVLVRDIELWSMCEHHLVPFSGVAHVGYIPNESGRITGLSKLARLVDVYARRPQVQERLTTQVADSLMRDPAGPRRDRRHRGRAPVHDDARGPQAGIEDDHLGDPGQHARRGDALGGDEPHHARDPLTPARARACLEDPRATSGSPPRAGTSRRSSEPLEQLLAGWSRSGRSGRFGAAAGTAATPDSVASSAVGRAPRVVRRPAGSEPRAGRALEASASSATHRR